MPCLALGETHNSNDPDSPFFKGLPEGNLQSVQDGGGFYQSQGGVRQCGVVYNQCVAAGPQMIESCSTELADCLKKAQSNLPDPYPH